jgi:hypothetical protein
MLKTKAILAGIILTLGSHSLYAQGQGNTPYSVFGFGELAEQSNTSQDMMGGTGASFSNGFYLNQINPALVVKNRTASGYKYVSLNVEFKGNSRTISNQNSSQNEFGFNLNNLSLTSAITENWAMGLALQPYSMVDYKTVITKPVVGGSGEVATFENSLSGGISRISYINSFRLFKNLYLGAEGHYNFGTIRKDSSSYLFNNTANQLRTNSRYNVRGLSYKVGVAYQQKLSEKWKLNAGVVMERSAELQTELLKTFAPYSDLGTGPYLTRSPDTLMLVTFPITTPTQYRFGISLESQFHWIFAADYHNTRWSGHKNLDKIAEQTLQNTEEYKFGIEYLPNSNSTKYFNQVFYRVGFATGNGPYVINGQQIKDQRVTFGISMPMGFRNPCYVNMGIALGNRGVITNNLIRENYIRFSLSMNLMGPWYIKPRID